MRLLITLASAAAMIGVAAPARADDSQDQAFLAALQKAGINFQKADLAVTAGNKVCELANAGMSAADVIKDVQALNPGFAGDGAATFTEIAAAAYCPQVLDGGILGPDGTVGGSQGVDGTVDST